MEENNASFELCKYMYMFRGARRERLCGDIDSLCVQCIQSGAVRGYILMVYVIKFEMVVRAGNLA